MKYKDFLKKLAAYDGDWDDEVIFVNYDKKPSEFKRYDGSTLNAYNVTSINNKDGKCIIDNIYDIDIEEVKKSL